MAESYQGLLVRRAMELGASRAVPVSGHQILLDERVRLKCRFCDSYGRYLMCPPYLPAFDECARALKRYSSGVLIQLTRTVSSKEVTWEAALALHRMVSTLEHEALGDGCRLALGLIGGHCRLCEECEGVRPGAACKYPHEARPSMEAMGVDVFGTAERAGLPLSFRRGEVTWTGLVLLE